MAREFDARLAPGGDTDRYRSNAVTRPEWVAIVAPRRDGAHEMPEPDEYAFGEATYFVAVKALLRDGAKLLITHDVFGEWDLPGGRLRPEDFETPLEDVMARKMGEEVPGVQYELGPPRVFFRHERHEHGLRGKLVRIFAIGYEAYYLGGSVVLGPHHDRCAWVDAASFDPHEFFVGGWLTGILQYQQLLRTNG